MIYFVFRSTKLNMGAKFGEMKKKLRRQTIDLLFYSTFIKRYLILQLITGVLDVFSYSFSRFIACM